MKAANSEWGNGRENPQNFNPTNLDTDQWIKTLKDAGFKRTIMVVKHHDGFVIYPSKYSNQQFQYTSPDKYSLLTLNGYAKDTVELGPDEIFGARLIADRLYSYWQNDKNQTILQGSKTIFALESAFLMKVAFSDGKHLFQWVFQKGDKVYSAAIESSANIVTTLRPFIEQSWGLDPNTPGK